MKKLLLGVASAALVLGATAAKAAINVSLWLDQPAAASDARFTNLPGLGAADATFSVPQIDFFSDDSDVSTIDQFLGTSLGGTVGNHLLDNTVFLFTGSLFLNAGDNTFVVPHDDGVQLDISGFGRVIDAPPATSEDDTPFTVTAASAGFHTFQLVYGECCSGHAVIRFTINDQPVTGGIPEPMTWSLMIMGFGAAGAMLRKGRKAAAAA